jgi:hypothetical protein
MYGLTPHFLGYRGYDVDVTERGEMLEREGKRMKDMGQIQIVRTLQGPDLES